MGRLSISSVLSSMAGMRVESAEARGPRDAVLAGVSNMNQTKAVAEV